MAWGAKRRPIPLRRWLRRQTLAHRLWLIGGAGLVVLIVMGAATGHVKRWRYDRAWVRLVRVVDGSTLCVAPRTGPSERWMVKLAGVWTPTGWARRSGAALEAFVAGAEMQLALTPDTCRQGRDGVGAWVYLPDGTLVNEWLIEQGWARAARSVSGPANPWLGRLERRARAQGRGMWAAQQTSSGSN